jgi:hypothetical protein
VGSRKCQQGAKSPIGGPPRRCDVFTVRVSAQIHRHGRCRWHYSSKWPLQAPCLAGRFESIEPTLNNDGPHSRHAGVLMRTCTWRWGARGAGVRLALGCTWRWGAIGTGVQVILPACGPRKQGAHGSAARSVRMHMRWGAAVCRALARTLPAKCSKPYAPAPCRPAKQRRGPPGGGGAGSVA